MSEASRVGGLQGTVIRRSGDKSVMVRVVRHQMHPKYKKYVTRTTDILAHDEENVYENGMYVLIEQAAPYSKRKAWKVTQLIEDRW
jgi:small subunit ribosomal protein S17